MESTTIKNQETDKAQEQLLSTCETLSQTENEPSFGKNKLDLIAVESETLSPPINKQATRKRKYIFQTDPVVPKKSRKIYFVKKAGLKPRKSKQIKSNRNDDKPVIIGRKHKFHVAKADANGTLYLAHRLHMKSDLFLNDEKKCSYEPFKKLDLAFHVVDEIALEGLDGITVEGFAEILAANIKFNQEILAFWKRLKNVFPNNINKTVADRIWRTICNNKRINLYILKDPREELVFFDRCKYLEIDSGMFMEPFIEFKDIYPIESVNGTDVRGSCSTFNTRKENNGVRKFSIEKALKLYDQKLVFVADQDLRNKALINEEADPNIELLDVEYCLLEKIGRTREQGELTQGKIYLVNDSKKLYHYRKVLSQYGLIVHQSFSLKSVTQQQNISGGLVHLTRFYHKRKTKYIAIMDKLALILRTKPSHQIEITEFRKIFGRNISVVKLMKTAEFRKFFKILVFPYRKLYPHATKQEYLHKNKQSERKIRVIRMIDPCANITALMDNKDSKEVFIEKADSSVGHKLINYEYLREIFLYILSSGTAGVTLQEINDYFKTDFYSIRTAIRKLILRNVIDSQKIDLGRQQSLKFYAKCFNMPGCFINVVPKTYELSEETLARVLENYDKNNHLLMFQKEPETLEITSTSTQCVLSFDPFCCTSFLTDAVDAYSEELTIYDIVSKGRDKLLLIQSNLFVSYMSEWDDFLIKRDDFSKSLHLFQSGLGKVIHDFLTLQTNCFETDNQIIFSTKDLSTDTKIARQFNVHRLRDLPKNFASPHSGNYYIDTISKIYIFEAMFHEVRKKNQVAEKLRNIYERWMISEGKKKRNCEVVMKPDVKIEVEVSSNVVMEKYMGSDPALEWYGQEEEIVIEIFSSTKPEKVIESSTFSTDDANLTQRYINRANLILKSVYERRIVQDVTTLYKDILKEEGEEGYDKKACKKSIVSIISKVVSEGYIKCYKVVMTGKNTTRSQIFICTHEITCHHPIIRSNIDQLKLKFYMGGPNTQKTITITKKPESPFSSADVKDSITELKQLTNFKTELKMKYDRMKGKSYGYAPKFVRMRVLHEHLFYVIRELTRADPLSPRQLFELSKSVKVKLSQTELTEMPPIYRNEVSWKMFIPPLPQHSNWPKGWALACDIVLRLPLSIFVKVFNVTYDLPDLESYLNHPIKKHYLVKSLPVYVRNPLLYRRKYIHSIYETISNLCYVGLVQLGPRNFKEKDQFFLYLNSRATLYDTSSSKPGYNQVEDKKYNEMPTEFKTGSDIEIYWSEMLRICMNTQLGKRKVMDGQSVTIEECASKPAMMETLKAKSFEEAVLHDNGKIPGDHRGSAGFDSSLWSFVKRNWAWNSQSDAETSLQLDKSVKKEKSDLVISEPVKYAVAAKNHVQRKAYPKKSKQTKKQVVKIAGMKKKRKKFVRKIIAPRKKRVRQYCDAIDRSIMKKNPGMRVEWSEEEDKLVRYCRIASLFLCPQFKKQFISYNVLRDVLHRVCPQSRNITAGAIKRRIYVLLTNDETLKIMETNIENLLNSDTISKYFEQIHSRYKTGVKLNDNQIYVAFVYLMSYICKHRKEVELLLLGFCASFDFFSDSNVGEFEDLLQNCDEGNNVVIYHNPKTVEDVKKDTIKSIIHCSMACRKNSVGWTFHLSRIYKKFQEDLIQAAVNSLRKDQFFVHNKGSDNKNIDNTWIAPIKFSHVYNMMKTTSYTIEMFRQTYRNFIALISGENYSDVIDFIDCNEVNSYWEDCSFIFDIPEMGIILNPEIADHTEVVEELAKRFHIYLNQIYQKNTVKSIAGTAATDKETPENSNENIEEIKGRVRHLIFRVPYLLEGDLDDYFRKMLDSNSHLEINNYIFLMIIYLKKFFQSTIKVENLNNFVDQIEAEEVDDQQRLVKNLSKIVFAIQYAHQHQNEENFVGEGSLQDAFSLWELEIRVEVNSEETATTHKTLFTKNSASGMENCIKRAQEGDFPTLEEIKEGIMAETEDNENRRIPHITDLITLLNEDRFPDLDTEIESIERMKEHFVMQYPKLEKFVIEDLYGVTLREETKKVLDEVKVDLVRRKTENVVSQPQLEKVIDYIKSNNGTQEDVQMTETLIDFIKDKKELGVSGSDLKMNFSNKISLKLYSLLEFLCEINVILRTGVASFIFVHHDYQTEWLTETFKLISIDEACLDFQQKQEIKKNFKSLLGEKIQTSDSIKVQLKPWTKLDGSVNDEVFVELLCVVLSRCVDFPNIPLLILCEHLHYIKPVDVYFLLEMLQEIGCVRIYLLNNTENNLFSRRCIIDEGEATCIDNFEDMFVKPTNISGLCFGSFLNKVLLE